MVDARNGRVATLWSHCSTARMVLPWVHRGLSGWRWLWTSTLANCNRTGEPRQRTGFRSVFGGTLRCVVPGTSLCFVCVCSRPVQISSGLPGGVHERRVGLSGATKRSMPWARRRVAARRNPAPPLREQSSPCLPIAAARLDWSGVWPPDGPFEAGCARGDLRAFPAPNRTAEPLGPAIT